jgi:hypothetical protein
MMGPIHYSKKKSYHWLTLMKLLYSRNKLFEGSLRIFFHTRWIDVKLLLNNDIVESSWGWFEKGKKRNKIIKRRKIWKWITKGIKIEGFEEEKAKEK